MIVEILLLAMAATDSLEAAATDEDDVYPKVLEPLLRSRCTVVFLDMKPRFLEVWHQRVIFFFWGGLIEFLYLFQLFFNSNHDYEGKASFLIQDSSYLDTSSLARMNKEYAYFRSCYIGVSYQEKVSGGFSLYE